MTNDENGKLKEPIEESQLPAKREKEDEDAKSQIAKALDTEHLPQLPEQLQALQQPLHGQTLPEVRKAQGQPLDELDIAHTEAESNLRRIFKDKTKAPGKDPLDNAIALDSTTDLDPGPRGPRRVEVVQVPVETITDPDTGAKTASFKNVCKIIHEDDEKASNGIDKDSTEEITDLATQRWEKVKEESLAGPKHAKPHHLLYDEDKGEPQKKDKPAVHRGGFLRRATDAEATLTPLGDFGKNDAITQSYYGGTKKVPGSWDPYYDPSGETKRGSKKRYYERFWDKPKPENWRNESRPTGYLVIMRKLIRLAHQGDVEAQELIAREGYDWKLCEVSPCPKCKGTGKMDAAPQEDKLVPNITVKTPDWARTPRVKELLTENVPRRGLYLPAPFYAPVPWPLVPKTYWGCDACFAVGSLIRLRAPEERPRSRLAIEHIEQIEVPVTLKQERAIKKLYGIKPKKCSRRFLDLKHEGYSRTKGK